MDEVVEEPDVDGGDRPVYGPPAPPAEAKKSVLRTAGGWVAVVCVAIVTTLLVQAFLIQPFRIPSDSMIPTLRDGDRIVVNKLSDQADRVHRGDVIVFTTPKCDLPDGPTWAVCGSSLDGFNDLVKRVVALPGEKVYIAGGRVFVDGRPLVEPYVRPGAAIMRQPWGCGFSGTEAAPYLVPAKSVFVMGDNRDNSFDSRCFGPIAESSIVGRAFAKIWPPGRVGGL